MKPVPVGLQNDPVVKELLEWAASRASVRAMLLTSTRANPQAAADPLSDHDVILVVDDIRPYYQDRSWLDDFGEVLVTYWDPIYNSPEAGLEIFGNVVQYVSGRKIDFTLWPAAQAPAVVKDEKLPADLDVGYVVLLDKDGLLEGLKPPTYTVYLPEPPTQAVFEKVIDDFYSDAPYVAKCLLRDELMPAKWCLEYDMKHLFLRPMLEWQAGFRNGWSIPMGALGKGLKKKLPATTWAALEATYAGSGIEENWEALFRTLQLFREVGEEVAAGLGYTFPVELDRRVCDFLRAYRR